MFPSLDPVARRPAGSALLLALLACFPAAMLLPRTWGWENGVLETVQVLVLLAGAVLAAAAWWRQRPSPMALLALCAVPFWLVLAAREMSWGAVLGVPLAFTENGPLFSSRTLWYKPFVASAVGLLLGCTLLRLWTARLDLLLRRLVLEGRIPWLLLGLAVVGEMGSSCAEGRLACTQLAGLPFAMVFEELTELVAYVALVAAQARVLARPAAVDKPVLAPAESLP